MTTDKLYILAIKYLARRPRSVKEMHQYLLKRTEDQKKIILIIDRLLNLGYLDDNAFARQFIDNRIKFKPKSVYALSFELREKGVPLDIIDDIISDLDNSVLARAALQLKAYQWSDLDTYTQKRKAINYLHYRGFNYETCKDAWEHFFEHLIRKKNH